MCKVLNVTTANGNKGIELYFEGKPSTAILNRLKAAFFRWHNVKKCWYHKDDENARRIAAELGDGEAEQTEQTDTQKVQSLQASAKVRKVASLWERCDKESIPAHPTNLADKEIAAQVRAHLKERFPEVKFSLRCSGYNSINGEIIASPYGRERIMKDRRTGEPDMYGYWQNSPALEAVLAYFDAYLQSYNYNNSDYMTDYFDVGFYGRFVVASKYEQTEATPEQAADMAAFEAAEKADKERKEAEAELEIIRQETERKAAAEKFARDAEIFNKRREEIYANIVIEDLPEAEQVAFTCLESASGKQPTLREVVDDISGRAGGNKIFIDAIVARKIVFNNAGDYGFFCDNLIKDWGFLDGYGGTDTADERVKSEKDYIRLTAEQRKTVHTFICDAIAVYNGGELQFVIDPEGYGYARYVLMATTSTTEQNAAGYRKEWKAKSQQLSPFYFPAPISEQLAKANLQAGEQITILKLDGWTCSVGTARGKLMAATPCEYAQYKDAAKIEYIPNGKRNGRYFYIANEKAVIYRGNLPEIPDSLKYRTIDHDGPAIMQAVNFAGEGAEDFIKTAIDYYAKLGYIPVLDTVQR